MATFERTCKDSVLAILLEAKNAGIRGVTRTSLVKYVYLLDVFVAEEKLGETTWTGLDWKFHHFGPYSLELADCLDWMEQMSFLEKEEWATSAGKDFVIYQAPDRADAKPLSALGIPTNVASRLTQAIREFASSLPQLLDFVYFRTAPMAHAHPGDTLSFRECRRVIYKEEVRQIPLRLPDKKDLARIKELIAGIKAERALYRIALPLAIYDAHYVQALEGDSGANAEQSGQITATLEFPRRDEDEPS